MLPIRDFILVSDSAFDSIYVALLYAEIVTSALLTLSAPYLSHETPSLRRHAETVSENAAYVALSVAETYMGVEADLAHGDIPPFVLPWLYMSGKWFLERGSLGDLSTIEGALERLNAKWKSAGTLSLSRGC
jgi:hypothetical protein